MQLPTTPTKVSVSPPKEAPTCKLIGGLTVYFCVGRRCLAAVSVSGQVTVRSKVSAFSTSGYLRMTGFAVL